MNLQPPRNPQLPTAALVADGAAPGQQPGRRRRLWQLPPAAHDLLLALSLPAAERRRLLQQALRRAHGKPCRVQGSDADVLYATVHDLGQRNAVSETLQDALQQAHAPAVTRLAAVRERGGLLAAWQQALQVGDVAATLWAVLTHRTGAEVQEVVLFDARAWVLERAQQAADCQRLQQLTQRRAQQAQDKLLGLQSRIAADKARYAADRAGLQAELSQLRGTVAALRSDKASKEAHAQAAATATAEPTTTTTTTTTTARPLRVAVDPPTTAPAFRLWPAQATPPQPMAEKAPARAANTTLPLGSLAPRIEGQRVLCVGGMRGALARYKRLVEDAGGHFEFHDGGVEDGEHRLAPQLRAADLVVCQAGCLNHGSYHRVKTLCRRLGKPCVFLERPSLSGFARGLALERTLPKAAAAGA